MTGSDWRFSKILQIRTGFNFSRTGLGHEKFHSLLICARNVMAVAPKIIRASTQFKVAVAYSENFHGGGFGSRSYGGYLFLVCAVCDVTI